MELNCNERTNKNKCDWNCAQRKIQNKTEQNEQNRETAKQMAKQQYMYTETQDKIKCVCMFLCAF